MPHKHPENRVYTVMSGVFCVGLGEQCDGSKFEGWRTRLAASSFCPAIRRTSTGLKAANT